MGPHKHGRGRTWTRAGVDMQTFPCIHVETYIWTNKSRHPIMEKQTQHPGTHRHAHSIPQAHVTGPSPGPHPVCFLQPGQPGPSSGHSAPVAPAPGSLQSSLLAHQWSLPPKNTGVHTQRPCIQTHTIPRSLLASWWAGGSTPQHLRPKDPLSLELSLPWAQALAHKTEGEVGPLPPPTRGLPGSEHLLLPTRPRVDWPRGPAPHSFPVDSSPPFSLLGFSVFPDE